MKSSASAKVCRYWAKKKDAWKNRGFFSFLEAPLPRNLKPWKFAISAKLYLDIVRHHEILFGPQAGFLVLFVGFCLEFFLH